MRDEMEDRLRADLPAVQVIDFAYHRRPADEKLALRSAFDSELRSRFLKDLARDHEAELRASGFSPFNIAALTRGRVPRGYQVHHIRPLDDGGSNDPSNLVLIRAHPEHEAVHRFLDPQLQDLRHGESRRVRLPVVPPGIQRPADPVHRRPLRQSER
jgi:hypothetical protein